MINNIIKEKLEFFTKLGMQDILVACSGGADSMALLNIAKEYADETGCGLRAIHINHNVQEANVIWEKQVFGWCAELDIDLHVVNLNNLGDAANMEENARIGRQQAVNSHIKDNEWLLTAHHANDQAENIIMALARAGGHNALSGMDEISGIMDYMSGKPMLKVDKKSVYEFCAVNKVAFVNDPTNFESVQDRNFVRNEVIPLLESRWPRFVQSVNVSAANIKKVSNIISEQVCAKNDSIFIEDIRDISDKSNEVLRIWLKKRFKKSPGNNIINQVLTFAKSDGGHCLDSKGFKLGVWKNTIYDLSGAPEYSIIGETVKYRKDLKGVKVRGITKSMKKLFQDFDVPPWDRDSIPLGFTNDELVCVGNKMVGEHTDTQQRMKNGN
jgi:tRNA(Ile)-lysidine synthase